MNCAVHTDTPAAAYCRTCGKALCDNCKRDVMGAIYCETCIAARIHGTQNIAAPPLAAAVPGAPNPGVAAFLGFIPGVGAMYNGQFIKGFIHVVIFVMLILGASEIHWIFGWMIAFFVFYMVFEAFKTAQARQLGLPAPDPLGIDHMFGLQEGQPASHAAGPTVETSTLPSSPPPLPRSNQPIGAIVLIALGVIFLIGNVTRVDLHRFWPLAIIGIGLWLAYKRTVMRT